MKKGLKKCIIFTIVLLVVQTYVLAWSQSGTNDMIERSELVQEVPEDDIAVFGSSTCFKRTYYIAGDRVNAYKDCYGKDKVKFALRKDEIIVAYKEENGYVYIENNLGNKGWVRKNKNNLKGIIEVDSEYTLDVDLTKQKIEVLMKRQPIKEIICSTGTLGDQDTETPLGIFFIQEKGDFFYSEKYQQGGKYYLKFFANYLIHSVPVDRKGNIIEEEKGKLGAPASHGCIRIALDDARWIYNRIPKGAAVVIHY